LIDNDLAAAFQSLFGLGAYPVVPSNTIDTLCISWYPLSLTLTRNLKTVSSFILWCQRLSSV